MRGDNRPFQLGPLKCYLHLEGPFSLSEKEQKVQRKDGPVRIQLGPLKCYLHLEGPFSLSEKEQKVQRKDGPVRNWIDEVGQEA